MVLLMEAGTSSDIGHGTVNRCREVRSLHEFRNHHSDDGCAYAEGEVTQQYYFHLHTSRS